MGHKDKIEYRLPLSAVRAAGTVTETKDTILGSEEVAPEASVALEVIGDAVIRTATIDSGLLRDTGVAFELTDDGRLVSSAAESTGQVGKAVLAVAGVGGLIAGAALGLPPALLAAAAGAVSQRTFGLDALADKVAKDEEDPVSAAYEAAHPGVMGLSKEYAKLVLELTAKMAEATRELAEAEDTGGRAGALWKLRSYSQGLAAAQAELERLRLHFKAWRAGTFETSSEKREYLIPLDDVRSSGVKIENGALNFPAEMNPEAVRVKRVWDELGLYVQLESSSLTAPTIATVKDNEILFRVPRRTRLDTFEKSDEGKPILIESKPYLIMDGLCAVNRVALRKSIWAKRSSTLKFSPAGALTGYASTATAAGAAFAETIQAVPGTVAGSLEQSKKIFDQVEGLRSRSLDQRLARVKKEVELKQQEITQDDLLVTAASHAELERLKQEAEILAQQAAIAGYDPPSAQAVEVAGLKKQIELLNTKHDLAVAQRALASEAEVGDIWREIERLDAQRIRDDLRKDGGAG